MKIIVTPLYRIINTAHFSEDYYFYLHFRPEKDEEKIKSNRQEPLEKENYKIFINFLFQKHQDLEQGLQSVST